MSLRTAISPSPFRAIHRALPQSRLSSRHHHRFLFNQNRFFGGPSTWTASRTLPYAQEQVYKLIADIDAYSSFIPYCTRSRVTQWSPPDEHGQTWPVEADLHVGYKGFEEVFTSQVRCVPNQLIRAFKGDAASAKAKGASSVLKSIVTEWQVRPVLAHETSPSSISSPKTQVSLTITYEFANPLYMAVTSVVSNEVAEMLAEAFQKRVVEQLGRPRSP
ncbi:hypothetical protein E4U13_002178 [Claviceps humidiphila]|uniref:Coenzyme Q-binding protein COQ10 START domain-containing protein n=1 Tax=Claviceps humidiphila TaxID=1294629 RepID=A0A9P7TUN6_9HYPO|nr:hypothetical protein E4U13_002178 [Claviceps humidiphila]